MVVYSSKEMLKAYNYANYRTIRDMQIGLLPTNYKVIETKSGNYIVVTTEKR